MSDDNETKVVAEKAKKPTANTKRVSSKPKPVQLVRPPKTYSFDQWASCKGVPKHHRRGMRAFVKNPNRQRTLEQWDACFIGY